MFFRYWNRFAVMTRAVQFFYFLLARGEFGLLFRYGIRGTSRLQKADKNYERQTHATSQSNGTPADVRFQIKPLRRLGYQDFKLDSKRFVIECLAGYGTHLGYPLLGRSVCVCRFARAARSRGKLRARLRYNG